MWAPVVLLMACLGVSVSRVLSGVVLGVQKTIPFGEGKVTHEPVLGRVRQTITSTRGEDMCAVKYATAAAAVKPLPATAPGGAGRRRGVDPTPRRAPTRPRGWRPRWRTPGRSRPSR